MHAVAAACCAGSYKAFTATFIRKPYHQTFKNVLALAVLKVDPRAVILRSSIYRCSYCHVYGHGDNKTSTGVYHCPTRRQEAQQRAPRKEGFFKTEDVLKQVELIDRSQREFIATEAAESSKS
jgi:hypothetical protein